jgi:hypothetical protein
MFTRPIFGTDDIAEQGVLLSEVARMVDAGTLKTTPAERFGTISAENLRRAHALVESGGRPRQDRAGGIRMNCRALLVRAGAFTATSFLGEQLCRAA